MSLRRYAREPYSTIVVLLVLVAGALIYRSRPEPAPPAAPTVPPAAAPDARVDFSPARPPIIDSPRVSSKPATAKPAAENPAAESSPAGVYTSVRRVVDGDTLLLPDGRRLRMIGINCPESVKPDHPVEPFGPEASAFTRQFIGSSKVRLQFDAEREDQYGRLLAYVYVGDRLLNEELLRAGLARYEPHYRYAEAMKTRYKAAQDEAREAKRGIWGGSR